MLPLANFPLGCWASLGSDACKNDGGSSRDRPVRANASSFVRTRGNLRAKTLAVRGPKMSNYATGMAAEFYVLSMLHRLGVTAYLTLGNNKAVDIVVTRSSGEQITIDVKGIKGKTSWPMNVRYISRQHYYVFVSFLGKMNDPKLLPEVYIVPSTSLRRLKYQNKRTGREFMQLRRLGPNAN